MSTSLRHPLTRALLVLTFTTGVIDAASYLGLGHVFTANMTGNVVLLGFGIAGGSGLPVVSPIVSLVAFLAGATVGGRMAGAFPAGAVHLSRSMLIEIGVVLLAALLALVLDVTPNGFSGDLVIALLALGMGVRNATVRRVKVADLTTTVLTMTLTGGPGAGPGTRLPLGGSDLVDLHSGGGHLRAGKRGRDRGLRRISLPSRVTARDPPDSEPPW